jgi:hypothetical protein
MFGHVAFFRRAFVAANLVCAASNSPANLSPSPPAPIRAAVQQDARPAARPAVQLIPDLPGRNPAPAGDRMNCDCRGLPSYTDGPPDEQMRGVD